MSGPTGPSGAPSSMIRLFVDLSDGISRTYDVTRYAIEEGVLRLYAPNPLAHVADAGGDADASHAAEELEVAAFAVGGWLRVERDLTFPPR